MYPIYAYDGIDSVWFYLSSTVHTGVGYAPVINLLCVVCAFVLLIFIIKEDNLGTLFSGCPLEVLVFWGGAQTSQKETPSLTPLAVCVLRGACVILVSIICFVLWCVRSFILGPCCIYALANNFAITEDAFDIVLNSVAVGFIFELDEVLYKQILPGAKRTAYETRMAHAPRPTSATVVPGTSLPLALTTNSVYVIDLVIGLTMWSSQMGFLGGQDRAPSIDVLLFDMAICRLALFASFEASVAYLARKAQARSQAVLMAHVAAYALVIAGSSLLVYTLVLAMSFHQWGMRVGFAEYISPEIWFCLFGTDEPAYAQIDCAIFHKDARPHLRYGNRTAFEFLWEESIIGLNQGPCWWAFIQWVWTNELDPNMCLSPPQIEMLNALPPHIQSRVSF